MEAGQAQRAEMVKMHLEYVQEVEAQKERTRKIDVQEWLDKGGKLFKEDRYEEALSCCDEALRIDPQDASAWHNKGMALGNLGRYEKVLSCCEEALRIDPQYPYAWAGKGVALYNLGRYEEAIVCFDNGLKYALIKTEYLPKVGTGATKFYLERISKAIAEGNMGTTQQFLGKIIELKSELEAHKTPEKMTGFNQLLIDSFIELLKKKQSGPMLELIKILEESRISKQTGFLFPLKILAQYLQSKDEDILNRQRPEVKSIIKEILSKISSK